MLRRLPFLALSLALPLMAAPVAAEITLSGQAAMGLDLGPSGRLTAQTRSRFDLGASTVTDGGVTFGAQIRLQGENGGLGCGRGGKFPSAQGVHRGCTVGAPMFFMEIGGN